MKQNKIEKEEGQPDIERKLQLIEERCINTINQMKEDLQEGKVINIPNTVIMGIYNEIFGLAKVPANCNASKTPLKSQKTDKKVEDQLILFFKKFLNEFIEEIFKKINECSNEKESVLREVSKTYHDYKAYSYWLYKMFYYLDKFAMPARDTTISNTSLELFKVGYFEKSKQKILDTILQLVWEARQNKIQMNIKVNTLIELFQVMGSKEVELKYHKETGSYDYVCLKQDDALVYYQSEFQFHLLQQVIIYSIKTQIYYKTEISEKGKFTTPEFVNWGNSIFEFEQQMAKDCYPQSELAIEKKLKLLFVKEQASQLVTQGTGVAFMLQSDRIAELKGLYDYIKKTKECIPLIGKAYQSHFEQQVLNINSMKPSDYEEEKQIQELKLSRICQIMEKAESILKNQFQDDPEIRKSFNVVFDKFLNMQKPMELE